MAAAFAQEASPLGAAAVEVGMRSEEPKPAELVAEKSEAASSQELARQPHEQARRDQAVHGQKGQ